MLYGGPLGTYLSGYYAPGAGSAVTAPPSSSASSSSAYPPSSSGTPGTGGLTRSRSSRFRTPSSSSASSYTTTGVGAGSASTTNNRSSFYTPQTRRKYGEEASNDSKKRYTTTGSGPNPTTRYTRPSYTTNISSTPHASSSMSPALETNTESDYKALYEAEKAETTQLKNSISAKQKQVDEIRLQIEDTRKASNPGDPDRRKGEGNLSEFDEEMKILETLRAESEKLKAEHRALTRVVSHLM